MVNKVKGVPKVDNLREAFQLQRLLALSEAVKGYLEMSSPKNEEVLRAAIGQNELEVIL